jgi:hypothetical protein
MVNPHWDETINEDEDIGFRGPHFNELKNYPDPTPYPGHETWSPRGEYGQHGEFSGWRSQEDPTSYTSDWQDYPGDEFTGIETIRPNKLGGPRGRGALRGLRAGITSRNRRRGPGPWNDFRMGMEPWPMDNDMMNEIELAKIYTSDMPGMQDPGTNLGFFSSDNFFDQLTPQGKAINDTLDTLNSHGLDLQGMLDQGYSRDAIYDMIPASIKQNLPRDAFETISDFRGQQPITVI